MSNKLTVKELKEALSQFPDEYDVCGIFEAEKARGHTFNIVIEQAKGKNEGSDEEFDLPFIHLVLDFKKQTKK